MVLPVRKPIKQLLFGWVAIGLLSLVGCDKIGSNSIATSTHDTVDVSNPLIEKRVDSILYNGSVFTGATVEVEADSSKSIRTYQSGILHGESIMYYPSGRMKHYRPYVEGEKHGKHVGFYDNDQPKFTYLFEHGFAVGNHKEWCKSGQLYRDLNYENGKERGAQKMYREDGKLRGNYVVRENGRIYGLVGVKRCKNINTELEEIDELDSK